MLGWLLQNIGCDILWSPKLPMDNSIFYLKILLHRCVQLWMPLSMYLAMSSNIKVRSLLWYVCWNSAAFLALHNHKKPSVTTLTTYLQKKVVQHQGGLCCSLFSVNVCSATIWFRIIQLEQIWCSFIGFHIQSFLDETLQNIW